MEHLVQLTYEGRVYTFRVEPAPPSASWRVEVEGQQPYRSFLRVLGDEQPAFFRDLAKRISDGAAP